MIKHTSGPCAPALRALASVLKFDLPLMMFVLPQVVHNVVAHGSDAAVAAVQAEVAVVLAAAGCQPGAPGSNLNMFASPAGTAGGQKGGHASPSGGGALSSPKAGHHHAVEELELYLQVRWVLGCVSCQLAWVATL